MKNFFILISFIFSSFISYSQCVPNSLYQDSTFGLWPDTVQNLPFAYDGVYYNAVLDIKTPSIVSDVVDPSQAYVLGMYIGNNTVDSITLVNVNGLPPGINVSCSSPGCSFGADTVGCTDLFGITNSIGQHPISFDINGWIHLNIFGINFPFDLYGATGSYQTISGYVLEVQPNFNVSYSLSSYNGYEVSCYGGNDGFINLSVPNSSAYSYSWSGPNGYTSSNMNISNLFAGTYTYTVTDANGYSMSNSVILNSPTIINPTISVSHPSCSGYNDGSVTISLNGGVFPYIEDWYGYNPNSLPHGTYYYEIIDGNSCLFSDSVTIIEPLPIAVFENIVDVSCFGINNGQVSLNISGGTFPYTEDWNGYNPNNLFAGLYSYTVLDNNNCEYIGSVLIVEPDLLYVNDSTVDASTCFTSDGQSFLSIYGGVNPYVINWHGYNPLSLFPGFYSYMVTDANNCVYIDTVVVEIQNVNALPFLLEKSDYNGYEVSCYAGNDGYISMNSLIVTIDSILWTGPQNFSSILQNNSNLYEGIYSYYIEDSLGCLYSGSISLLSPDSMSIFKIVEHPSCFGFDDGSVNLFVNGGVPSYIEDWSGYNPDSLSAGFYTFNVMDSNGCMLSDTITMIQPGNINVTETITPPLCFGGGDGSVVLSIVGGSSPYFLEWDGYNPNNLTSGLYNYMLIDNNGCEYSDSVFVEDPNQLNVDETTIIPSCFGGNNGSAILSITGGFSPYSQNWFGANPNALSSGIYMYQVSDSNGCIFSDSLIMLEPSLVTFLSEIISPLCYGENTGQVNLSISGGTPPYIQNWNGMDPNALFSGSYYFSIVDDNGCFVYDTIFVNNPSIIQTSLVSDSFNIVGSAFGGNPPYTYDFIGPSGVVASIQTMGVELEVNPIESGMYIFQVTEDNGCVVSDTVLFDVIINSIVNDIFSESYLLKVVDILGRKVENKNNIPLFYIYSDGRVEKKIIIE